jgi:LacI family transcriptional regulator
MVDHCQVPKPYAKNVLMANKSKKKPQVVTLRMIADKVGVSVATVSRVLNLDPSLSVAEDTRRAVIETAEKLSYTTPRRRRAGKATENGRITLYLRLRQEEELLDHFYVAVRLGIEKRCNERHRQYDEIYQTDSLPSAREINEADGVIVVGHATPEEVEWLRDHARAVVFAGFAPEGDDIDCVTYDLRTATRKLLNGLEERGYRRIAMAGWHDVVHSNRDPGALEDRSQAYVEWMKERGYFDPDLLNIGKNSAESGLQIAREFLALRDRPDVILTSNDLMALGAYRAVEEYGLRIPEDIGIVGVNDIPAARFLNPPLSTIRLPAEGIGETAVDLLIERFGGRELAKHVNLECRMIWRESSPARQ